MISSITFNPELALAKGTHTKLKPTTENVKSIKKGIQTLNKLNAHNHVQGLVIRNSNIISRETYRGTKKMLQSIKKSKSKDSGHLTYLKNMAVWAMDF